jgi:hypothetical protein
MFPLAGKTGVKIIRKNVMRNGVKNTPMNVMNKHVLTIQKNAIVNGVRTTQMFVHVSGVKIILGNAVVK